MLWEITTEFKDEAVRQVIDNGYAIKDVANRLGITDKSLYNWVSKAKKTPKQNKESKEINRLKAELKRVTQERDILKEAPRSLQASQGKIRVHKVSSR